MAKFNERTCNHRIAHAACALLVTQPQELSGELLNECCGFMAAGECPLYQKDLGPIALAFATSAHFGDILPASM